MIHASRITSNAARSVALALLVAAVFVAPASARKPSPFNARSGIDLVSSAAHAWATDAILITIENDEPLDGTGGADRWGYLFYSPGQDRCRAYSVRDGRILVAEYLEKKFEAPEVAANWMDSGAALAVADRAAGAAFCRQNQGFARTMLLMRGAFQDEHPDQTTWTVVYSAPHAASLFVMVDAAEGKVRRTWRG
jgi:hypothetical protein